ncbi:right-handed parallel beta-helix repeat-containing protein [Acidobacteriota bacterium]
MRRTRGVTVFIFSAFIASCCLVAHPLHASVFYVCITTGNDSNSGADWNAALRTLDTAFQHARSNAEPNVVFIAQGDYPLTDWEVPPGTRMYGGFPSGGGARDVGAYNTTININDGACVALSLEDDSTVDGFEILGCKKDRSDSENLDRYGVSIVGSNNAVRNCKIHGSYGDFDASGFSGFNGTGIQLQPTCSDIVIRNNEIYDNCGSVQENWGDAGHGYGIAGEGTMVWILDNTIYGNLGGGGQFDAMFEDSANGGHGHGITIKDSELFISGNRIEGNYGGSTWGGEQFSGEGGKSFGIKISDSQVTITHNEIYDHRGGDSGAITDMDPFNVPGNAGYAYGIRLEYAQARLFNNLITGINGGDGGWDVIPGARGGDAGAARGIDIYDGQSNLHNNTVADVHPGIPGMDWGQPSTGYAANIYPSSAVIENNVAYGYEDHGFSGSIHVLDFRFNLAWSDRGLPFGGITVDPSNSSESPLFVAGPMGDYYLSQISAGQAVDSPCLDGGSDLAAAVGLADRTTRTDEILDTDTVDQGYHFPSSGISPGVVLMRNEWISSIAPLDPPKDMVLPLDPVRDHYLSSALSPVRIEDDALPGPSPLVFYSLNIDTVLHAQRSGDDVEISF